MFPRNERGCSRSEHRWELPEEPCCDCISPLPGGNKEMKFCKIMPAPKVKGSENEIRTQTRLQNKQSSVMSLPRWSERAITNKSNNDPKKQSCRV